MKNMRQAEPPEKGPVVFPLKTVLPLLIIALLAIGVILRFVNLNHVAQRSPDEGIYTNQAKVISIEGPIKGTRALVREYNQNARLWIYPPPTRIGYDWLLGGVMKALNRTDTDVGAYISFAASILSLLFITLIGLRFFDPLVALFALLFMAVSPMELAIARRTWQDALFGLLGLSMVYYVLEIAKNPKRLLWYIVLIISGSYIILVKEPGAAVYGLCVLWVACMLAIKEKSIIKASIFIIAGAVSVIASYGLISYAVGGIGTLLNIFAHIKDAMPTNEYAIEYQSGPWTNFIGGLWILSPLSFLLFIAGAAGTFLPIGRDEAKEHGIKLASAWLMVFSAAFFSIAIITPYCQNYRYVSVIYAPFYLAAGTGLWYLSSWIRPLVKDILKAVIPLLAAVLIFAAARDYQMFEKIFIRTGIMDISVKMVRDFSK